MAAVLYSMGKIIHCMRHGPSSMNAYFNLHRYGSPHQEPVRADPMIFDAQLTSQGTSIAMAAGVEIQKLSTSRPDVVLVSPLRRCMETAQILLSNSNIDCEVMAFPLLRERLTLSSDVGSIKSVLMRDFPSVSFPSDASDGEGMDEEWWFRGEGNSSMSDRIDKEPTEVYEARLQMLRARLRARKESCILIISHWGVINSLTGLDLSPAQIANVDFKL